MTFSISKSGTTDEIRQALYDAERAANPQNDEEKLAVRAIGHAIAVHLDAKDQPYNDQVNVLRGAYMTDAAKSLAKPTVTVSANCTISIT